ncbi:dihydroorotate dehydrogenase B catalytic subunit [Candidatus Bathyarchaeota archaeon]|nr:dihydroorotate dehydrogenase B catalytic subunit [Candidatus Bathyarchaeota archaeon]MDP6048032.1 dihydroorotate dehydrogenase [Candidatus Bathyarchaeota archaeon]MDP7443461.1 dihydroorotate dehydrogenase [Candidatus Bathyarchaeota archaeon]
MSQLSLSVDVAGLRLRNPTMNAAGVLGISAPLLKRVYDGGAGAVVTKSLGPKARQGHLNPTMVIVEGGFLNAMGLPNPGAEYFVETIKALKADGVPVVASFFGESIEDFRDVAELLSEAGADALEVNVSCPNVQEEMGMLGADCLNTERVTAAVKEVSKPPVFVKLSPNVTDIAEIARAAERGGADAITAVNTLKGIAIDTDFRRPILTNVTGGLSGPALKPVSLRCVWDVANAVKVPVIGCGGITNWKDAVEFMLAGASAVEVGTAIRERGFSVYSELTRGIKGYLEANGFRSVREIVGLAKEAKL